MSCVPENLKYTETHEWVRKEDDGSVTVGITDHAQSMLGDLVFVELPEDDSNLSRGEECVVLESVKAAADVYAPLSGAIVEINDILCNSPEEVNQSPYEHGWLFRMMPSSESEVDELLTAEDYKNCVKAEAH